jgi:hypothetical protein
MMTTEELLAKRYKVTAPYPGCVFKVGDILTYRSTTFEMKYEVYTDQNNRTTTFNHFDEFPHLFQPLPWWSDRAVEDMPEYLRIISNPLLSNARIGEVVKVLKHFTSSVGLPNANGFQVLGNDYIGYYKTSIATREEYEAYQQSKNK